MSPISNVLMAVGAFAVAANAASATGSPTASAESHVVSALVPDIADGDMNVSVVSAGASATTYLACQSDGESPDSCAYSYTLVAGPSTAAIMMSLEGYEIDIGCKVTPSASFASCSAVTASGTSTISTATTFTDFSDFRTDVTVTAGYAMIASATAGPDSESTATTTKTKTSPSESTSAPDTTATGGSGAGDDDSAASGRVHGAALAGFVAIIGGLMML